MSNETKTCPDCGSTEDWKLAIDCTQYFSVTFDENGIAQVPYTWDDLEPIGDGMRNHDSGDERLFCASCGYYFPDFKLSTDKE